MKKLLPLMLILSSGLTYAEKTWFQEKVESVLGVTFDMRNVRYSKNIHEKMNFFTNMLKLKDSFREGCYKSIVVNESEFQVSPSNAYTQIKFDADLEEVKSFLKKNCITPSIEVLTLELEEKIGVKVDISLPEYYSASENNIGSRDGYRKLIEKISELPNYKGCMNTLVVGPYSRNLEMNYYGNVTISKDLSVEQMQEYLDDQCRMWDI